MKIIHKEGFTDAELAEYRPIVYKNVLDSAQAVIIYMRKIGWDFVGYSNRVCFLSLLFPTFLLMLISTQPLADKVLDYRPDSETSYSFFPPDIADAIHQLWKDPIITKIMDEKSSEFYLMDSAA
jgi:guanine nucleotide-binding protein G(i) subunit alpha